jgi:tRNA A-37 threonylcarbamoyl transferase component Bud32
VLRAELAGRYDVDRPVGQGGMATVYLARDVRHGRRVAIKVLRPDLSATLGSERFLREIQIAARLGHPNIVMLIDSGEAAGLLYYVMPFIDGESLRQRLDREQVLPPADVTRIAREVGGALAYAHDQGVVHRDIKPENILFAAGHAVVTDFGVARAVTTAAARQVTRTGYPVGTVGYMSPEQAAGFTDLTLATDVYSLGCVVYEMLVGEVPGHWPSEEAGRVLRLLEARPEHRARLDRLPGAVEQVLARALRMRPAERFASPADLADALGRAFEPGHRYSETAVRDIVARAAELEARAPTRTGALSLGGMQQLAAEVGIPPEHVAEAARDVVPHAGQPTSLAPRDAAAPAVKPAHPLLGAPTRIVAERWVDREVSEADYPAIVDEARMAFSNVGQASTLGRSLAWHTVTPPNEIARRISLTVTVLGGRTRIRLEERLAGAAAGWFGGLGGGLGGASIAAATALGAGVLGSAIAFAGILATGLTGSWTLARGIFRYTHRTRKQELEALADRLALYLADPVARLPR